LGWVEVTLRAAKPVPLYRKLTVRIVARIEAAQL
jgi:hypothetical protein